MQDRVWLSVSFSNTFDSTGNKDIGL
jgi:hypothetical protein